ncbi:aspartic peptidase domain-containing protein [Tuber brumale]|nr:aspartic peptidase domain-containing protein [Tuber brumale]
MKRVLKYFFDPFFFSLLSLILLSFDPTFAAEEAPKPIAVAFTKDETLFDEEFVTTAIIANGTHKIDLIVANAASETIIIIANNDTCQSGPGNFAAACHPDNNSSSISGMDMHLPTGKVFEWKEESHRLYARGNSANGTLQLRKPGSLDASVDLQNVHLYYTTPAESNLTFGILGLGKSSPLLRLLSSDRLITSNAYGLYLGAEIKNYGLPNNTYSTQDTSYPGSLVLGGYDRKLLAGDVIGGRLSPNNFPRIEISEVILHNDFETGQWPQSTGPIVLDVDSLTPDWELPPSVVTRLTQDIGAQLDTDGYYSYDSRGSNLVGNVSMKIKVPSDLTFQEEPKTMKTVKEITITIPGSEFYQLHPSNYVNNGTIPEPNPRHYIPVAVASKRFVAGRAFLRSMYLVVDYDKGEFFIGPTSWRPENGVQDLVPIVSPWFRGAGNEEEKRVSRAPIIIGLTVGGISLVFIVLGVWGYRQKRKIDQAMAMYGPSSDTHRRGASGAISGTPG